MSMPHVVILGSGFGGFAAAKRLAPLARAGKCRVTVVDRNEYHVFTPLLYETATGFVEHENIGSAKLLSAGITVANDEALARWGANFVHASIAGVDMDGRTVTLRDAEPLRYDYLVIALGSEAQFFGIPGLEERAYTLKSVKDAERLRQRVHDVLHRMERGRDEDGRLRVLIGGGGPTGVETAAELTYFLRRHMMKGHLKPSDFSITLVEAQPRLLAMLPKKLSDAALARLRAMGVTVYLDSAVQEVGMNSATLKPRACKPGETVDQLVCDFKDDGQKEVAADLVIWTGGIRGTSCMEKMGLPVDPRGKRVEVGPTFELAGHRNTFAIGDATLLMDPKTKQPVPWLAQSAMLHGDTVARTIAGRIRADHDGTVAKDAIYDFPAYPIVVPLGGKNAVAHVGGVTLYGFMGWLVKEAANLRYFITILPLWSGIKKWWHGALTYGSND